MYALSAGVGVGAEACWVGIVDDGLFDDDDDAPAPALAPASTAAAMADCSWALEALVYVLMRASHRASLSWRSWCGLRRLRGGAGVLGVHPTPAWDTDTLSARKRSRRYVRHPDLLALVQFEHGLVRSHLIFRCWHKTQASTRVDLECDVRCERGDVA
jgi:hypothetical protein